MIEFINTSYDHIVGFRMDSTASEADMKPLFARLNEKLRLHQRLRLLIEYVDDQGFSLDTLVEDVRYSFSQPGIFEKTAVITCRDWLQQASQLAYELKDTQLKSFHYSEKDLAFRWIEHEKTNNE